MPLMDLIYLSMIVRSLSTRTLLVAMIIPSTEGLMNSAQRVNFKLFNKLLMDPMC